MTVVIFIGRFQDVSEWNYLSLVAADDIVGVEPTFDGTAVEVFAFGGRNAHGAAVFDVVIDGVGDHVFLVFRAKVVFVDVFNDALQEFRRHDVFRDVDEIGGGLFGGGFLDDVYQFAVFGGEDAVFFDVLLVDFDAENGGVGIGLE